MRSSSPTRSPLAGGATLGGNAGHRAISALAPSRRRHFEQDGYLTLRNFCTAWEIAWLRSTLTRLFAERIGREQGTQFDMLGPDLEASGARQPQILSPSQFVPELLQSSFVTRAERIAKQLLGPHARLSFDHSILKPAGSAAATPWHQDEAHHTSRLLRYPQISYWLALQDATLENGCMRYVPGSNHGPLLPHRRVNDDPRIHAIECSTEHFDVSQSVAIPLEAGSCILHGALTLHSALPNISGEDRLAYIVVFTGPPLPAKRNASSVITRGHTANLQRRHRWLLHGGILTMLRWRVLRARHANPRALWHKLRAMWQASLAPAQRLLLRLPRR